MNSTNVILLGGGTSTRFNYIINKINVKINNKYPLDIILHELEKVNEIYNITKIIIVGNVEYTDKKMESKIVIINGGNTRIESIYNGLNNVDKDVKKIIVHDIARPYVSSFNFIDILEKLDKYEACGIKKKAVNTIIGVKDNILCEKYDRTNCYESLTPQGFTNVICKQLLNLDYTNFVDETEFLNIILTNFHEQIYMLDGNDNLEKITYLEDLLYFDIYSKINKKTVLITGVTGNIGNEILKELSKYKFKFIFLVRNIDKFNNLILNYNIDYSVYTCDFLHMESVTKSIDEIKNDGKMIDYIIISHGNINFNDIDNYTETEIQEIISINYLNNILFIKNIMNLCNAESVVINISSSSIDKSRDKQQIYSSTKIAFHNIINGMRYQYKNSFFYNIVPRRCNTLSRNKALCNINNDFSDNGIDPSLVAKNIINIIISANKGTNGDDIWIK